MIDINEVKKLAQLARIEMSEAEMNDFIKEVDPILGYVDQLKKVAGTETERQVGELHNVTRKNDNPNITGSQSDILIAEFPKKEGNLLKVKKIL